MEQKADVKAQGHGDARVGKSCVGTVELSGDWERSAGSGDGESLSSPETFRLRDGFKKLIIEAESGMGYSSFCNQTAAKVKVCQLISFLPFY